ncbi:dTDP-4-dehydrorhamnose 3,5-epimerase [Rhizobium sp. CFBP 8762]|uniref:dTDP-4-dehydrorhamnose 3,5-epimerase n=1 Tax=Rhizobium sp. CFBP 8762 TaxID=2775279 RepID=UPI001786C29C|nr:dTDP-4-dehydrorhamnose 3,5-epimerase [Rhizobium sp. CFBP 8762]MBD8554067.1 dTDP-4-dehydrorhamnose 3,5-epimerase [Rhizobium sp. CFBP 8762]
MQFSETQLAGVWLIEPEPFIDHRGSFARTFCVREFEERALTNSFVQHSQSYSSARHTLRGLHMQLGPHEEVKLVSCVRGAVFDVAVDMRPHSRSYLHWFGTELGARNGKQMYIPQGFAHGFLSLTDDAVVSYLISVPYAPQSSVGFRYDDPAIGIDWPARPSCISEKDESWSLIETQEVRYSG